VIRPARLSLEYRTEFRRSACCAALIWLLTALAGYAAGGDGSLPPLVPPPEFIALKPPIPDLLLKNKREGVYYTGLPLIGYDAETGFNYGASVYRFDNGPVDSPFFRYAPYRRCVTVSVQAATNGLLTALVAYDEPYVRGTPWRISAYAGYWSNERENFFGAGEPTLGDLRYPGSFRSFTDFNEYADARDRVTTDLKTWSRYDAYRKRQLGLVANLHYDLLRGRLRALAGLQLSRLDVEDYSGLWRDGGVQQETRLAEQSRQGLIRGFDGGWNNLVRLGVTYDTRDFEPDPSSGILAQILYQQSAIPLGSTFNYGQVTSSFKVFRSLLPEFGRLVLAGNVTYAARFGTLPFFALPNLAVPVDEGRRGLGGFQTLRGFRTNRFIGNVTAHANAELRWRAGQFTVLGQHMGAQMVGFVDGGRVFDSVADTTLRGWKVSGGAGFALAWNLATVIRFDYGIGREGSVFYMEIGHQF
jgi:outer membrane protein assembly factor BamA